MSKEELIKRLLPQFEADYVYTAPYITSKKLFHAVKYIASKTLPSDIIGLFDSSLFGSCKRGIVFTKTVFL